MALSQHYENITNASTPSLSSEHEINPQDQWHTCWKKLLNTRPAIKNIARNVFEMSRGILSQNPASASKENQVAVAVEQCEIVCAIVASWVVLNMWQIY
ncbi:hypothetical protein LTR05_001611 [Lithohypha guttulata]|uniref:Uncharacterized protein n=1 Tax=Lithohypha guttulata TaxID=1690604 RepID=A0AAN7YKC0_9EURO|nr:hypothetical protein LTR05_001611 [Lithohypha guttulata]